MCGIFSAISFGTPFKEQEKDLFEAANEAMLHRGPDAGKTTVIRSKDVDSGFNIFLGHRRLSIIDLDEKSNQPMEADGYQIIFNGEIFNYLELRKELEKEYTFRTNSDTEVILRSYQKHGTKQFGQFNGMWAFVIYDPKKNCIVISRDRFSVKPLFMLEQGNRLFMASEIKSLKKLGLRFSPDQTVIERFLNQQLIDVGTDTFYKEIKLFPAMTTMTVQLETGERTTEKYWGFTNEKLPSTFGERREMFRDLLLNSLRLRLRSDVPLGTLLSGGLDSSAITTLIHDHLDPNVQSFSVVSDEAAYSEEPFVDLLVRKKGISNHKLRFNTDDALENISTVLHFQDEPFGSLGVVAQHLLFKKIRTETNVTVLLSGQGADEVLLGYNKFFYFYLRELKKRKQFIKMMSLAGSSLIKGTTIKEFSWKQAKRYLPGKTNKGRPFFRKTLVQDKIWEFENMTDRQIQDINLYSIPQLTHYEDRNSMSQHIEVRLPFMDYRLVNFLVHCPVDDKLKGGWTKYILREACHELPDEIRWRKDKKGFITPEEKWLSGPLGEYMVSFFESSSRLEEMGILDRKEFIHTIKNFKAHSKWLVYSDLFAVFITEMWLRENF
jgi:asparagine synthase (glutamine-hydrolysing)